MFCISNRGEVETGALALLGASTKDGDQIGKFGSGLKYALATLLRKGIAFRIFSGTREIIIGTEREDFRDQSFEVMTIDGKRTSITTRTGVEWTVADAFREIWSNAVDEGEPRRGFALQPTAGRTTIMLEEKPFKTIIENWTTYFVTDVKAVFSCHAGRILNQSLTNFFRRGVWICEDRNNVPIFSYDFHDIRLPESRKINSWSCIYKIVELLQECNNPYVFEKLFANASPKYAEWNALDQYGLTKNSVGHKAALEGFHRKYDFWCEEKMKEFIPPHNYNSKRVLWVKSLNNAFRLLDLPHLAENLQIDERYEPKSWPIGYRERVDEILAIIEPLGISYSNFEIIYAEPRDLFETALAIADMKTKRCVLFPGAFESTPQMLTKALVEEWTHLAHGVTDGSVAQQHVYLDLIVKLIERRK